jgi:hypothetical protein
MLLSILRNISQVMNRLFVPDLGPSDVNARANSSDFFLQPILQINHLVLQIDFHLIELTLQFISIASELCPPLPACTNQ